MNPCIFELSGLLIQDVDCVIVVASLSSSGAEGRECCLAEAGVDLSDLWILRCFLLGGLIFNFSPSVDMGFDLLRRIRFFLLLLQLLSSCFSVRGSVSFDFFATTALDLIVNFELPLSFDFFLFWVKDPSCGASDLFRLVMILAIVVLANATKWKTVFPVDWWDQWWKSWSCR